MPPDWSSHTPEERRVHAHAAAQSLSLSELREVLDAYLQFKATSDSTRMNYRSRLKIVIQYLQATEVDLLNPPLDLGDRFLTKLSEMDFNQETVRAYASTLRLLYEALAWNKIMIFDPFFIIDISKFLNDLNVRKRF